MMDHTSFGEALAYGMPGQHFVYHGDGSTVDGLTFLDVDGAPIEGAELPTIEQVAEWSAALDALPRVDAPAVTPISVAQAMAAAVTSAADFEGAKANIAALMVTLGGEAS